MPDAYLDEALADFSGYLAIDEVYDGPFCVLCVVDNRRHNRLACCVVDRSPTQEDVRAFLAGFKVLEELWPGLPHHLCEFHVVKEINKAVLHALASQRRRMRAEIPPQGRGQPSKQRQAQARRAARQKERVAGLFEHRHLFVRNGLTPSQKTRLRALTRGLPQLRALREIMDEVYRLVDRRCETETALAKLGALRERERRFKKLGKSLDKLKSPTLEKALVFLDDKLLPSTSNAVERINRRSRKAQQSVYSARTKTSLEQRLALDMHREQRAGPRGQTTQTLHKARASAGMLH